MCLAIRLILALGGVVGDPDAEQVSGLGGTRRETDTEKWCRPIQNPGMRERVQPVIDAPVPLHQYGIVEMRRAGMCSDITTSRARRARSGKPSGMGRPNGIQQHSPSVSTMGDS